MDSDDILTTETSHSRCSPNEKVLKRLQEELEEDDFKFVLDSLKKNLMIPLGELHRFEKLFPDCWEYKSKDDEE